MVRDLLVFGELVAALGHLLRRANCQVNQGLCRQLRKLVRKNLWPRLPLVEGSLKVGLDVVDLVFAEAELVANELPDPDILLPAVHDVGKPLLLRIAAAPPDNVFLHEAVGFPVDVLHHVGNFVFAVLLLTHEILEILNLSFCFPVVSSSRSAEVLIIKQLGTIVCPPPIIECFS